NFGIVPHMGKMALQGVLLLLLAGPAMGREFQHPKPIRLDHGGDHWARKTLKKLSIEEKIGQMLMIRVMAGFMDAMSPDYLKLSEQISRYHLGSVLLTVPSDGGFLNK